MKSFFNFIKTHLFTILVILIFIALIVVISIFAYAFVYKPYDISFSNQITPTLAKSPGALAQLRAEWGQFGDYFGGTLNPIFGFASFIALLITILYQAKELNASTKELKNSAIALTNQNKAIELQSFEQTILHGSKPIMTYSIVSLRKIILIIRQHKAGKH